MDIILSPNAKLFIDSIDEDNDECQNCSDISDLVKAFHVSSGSGLLYLDIANDIVTENASFAYWKDFARLYLSLFAATPNLEQHDVKNKSITVNLPHEDLERFLLMVPSMKGAEYVSEQSLTSLWHEIGDALLIDIITFIGQSPLTKVRGLKSDFQE